MQEFCRRTGLGRDTVRFYVRQGLLRPTVGTSARGGERGERLHGAASGNRYQDFDESQVERARLIRSAQALGFTLREIAGLAAAYEAGGLTRARKVTLLRAHLATLDMRAADLDAVRTYLQEKLAWMEAGASGAAPAFTAAQPVDGQRAAGARLPRRRGARR